MSTLTEAAFQRQVTDLATLRNWRWWHDHDSRRNRAGLPDLILLRRERLIFAELKSQRGRLRPEQLEWIAALVAAGVDVRVWRPDDMDEIVEVLR